MFIFFFFSSRRRHTRSLRDWSSDVCSSDLKDEIDAVQIGRGAVEALEGHLRRSYSERLVHEVRGRDLEPVPPLVVANRRVERLTAVGEVGPAERSEAGFVVGRATEQRATGAGER